MSVVEGILYVPLLIKHAAALTIITIPLTTIILMLLRVSFTPSFTPESFTWPTLWVVPPLTDHWEVIQGLLFTTSFTHLGAVHAIRRRS